MWILDLGWGRMAYQGLLSSRLTVSLPPWSSEHKVSSGVNSADTERKLVTSERPAVQSLRNTLQKPRSRRTWQKAALSENLANFFFFFKLAGAICHGYSDLRARLNGRHFGVIKQVLSKYFHTFPSCQKLFFFFTKDIIQVLLFFCGFFVLFLVFLSFCLPCHRETLLFCWLKNGLGCRLMSVCCLKSVLGFWVCGHRVTPRPDWAAWVFQLNL